MTTLTSNISAHLKNINISKCSRTDKGGALRVVCGQLPLCVYKIMHFIVRVGGRFKVAVRLNKKQWPQNHSKFWLFVIMADGRADGWMRDGAVRMSLSPMSKN